MSSQDETTNPNLEKPISVPPGCVSIEEFRDLKLSVEQMISENRAVIRLFLPDKDGNCPVPPIHCRAMDLAKTAMRRSGHPKLWIALGSAVIVAVGAVVGAGIQAITSGVAIAQTKETIAVEMPKYQKSTETIAREGGKLGGLEALTEFERTHAGLVVTSNLGTK
jgi:hypothetical protein